MLQHWVGGSRKKLVNFLFIQFLFVHFVCLIVKTGVVIFIFFSFVCENSWLSGSQYVMDPLIYLYVRGNVVCVCVFECVCVCLSVYMVPNYIIYTHASSSDSFHIFFSFIHSFLVLFIIIIIILMLMLMLMLLVRLHKRTNYKLNEWIAGSVYTSHTHTHTERV